MQSKELYGRNPNCLIDNEGLLLKAHSYLPIFISSPLGIQIAQINQKKYCLTVEGFKKQRKMEYEQ